MDNGFNFEFSNALKQIQEQAKALSDSLQSIIQPAIDGMNRYKEILAPIIEHNRQLKLSIETMLPKFELPDSVKVISKLKEAQYVFWDYMPRSFVDDLLVASDADDTILEYESKNDFAVSDAIISKCLAHNFIKPHLSLFEQCISSYRGGFYNLSAVGFSAVIDAALTEATKNPTHRSLDRCYAILDKLKEKDVVDDEEFAILTLFMTFNATVESFYKSAPFSEEEPDEINRNWIVHGRTMRSFTRLDCIKLIRILYGIIIISEFESKDTTKGGEHSDS